MMQLKYSLRTHVTWLTLAPLLIMAIGLEAFFLHTRSTELDRDLFTRGQLIARQLAASSEYGVFSTNHAFLEDIARNTLQQPDVSSVLILNGAAKVLVVSGQMPVALGDAGKNKPTPRDIKKLSTKKLLELVNRKVPQYDDDRTLLLYQPIIATQVALDELAPMPTEQQVGAVIIEMNWEQTRKLQSRLMWYTILITTGFLLITLYLMHLASSRIIKPISRLSAAIQAIGSGDLDTRVTQESCINELCTLSDGINQMTHDLQHERSILQQRIDEATEQLRNLAFYDTLTQLPNRRLLNDRLAHALATSKRSGRYGALIFLDLDNFKPVNDLYGHAVGDRLLIEAAKRLSTCIREMDTVARFGGDEFVVMLGELDTKIEESVRLAYLVTEKIRTRLGETYHLLVQRDDQPDRMIEHHCSSSIGVVMFLDHHASQDELMTWADHAMYQAKQAGRNCIKFHSQQD